MQMTAEEGLPRNEFLGSQDQTFHWQRQQGNSGEQLQINCFTIRLLASHEKSPTYKCFKSTDLLEDKQLIDL